ncbi:MAG: penicillin-binding protein activator [Alphaproteobacteria bacterium]|nr:penicillin-binding protein activator [Alphaproteobacteria bacterium]
MYLHFAHHSRLLNPAFWLGLVLLLNACAQLPPPPIKVIPPSTPPTVERVQPEIKPEPKITQPESIPEPDVAKTLYQVAILLPLSGQSAALGQHVLQGAEIALYRYAKDDFTLKLYDTQGRRFAAIQTARQAINDDADIVLGPLFNHTSTAVIPLLQQAGIPMMSFANSDALLDGVENLQNGAGSVHILGVTPKEELRQLIDVGVLSGFSRFALIAPDDDYGQKIHRNMQALLGSSTAQFARVAYYDPNEIDFTGPIQRLSDYRERRIAYKNEVQRLIDSGIKNKNEIRKILNFKETFGLLPFDAVVLITYNDNSLRTLASQLEYYEVEPERVKFMGLRQWQNFPNLHVEPSLHSSWFIGTDSQRFALFQQLHQEVYQEPGDFFAALGFDSIAMLAHFTHQSNNPIPTLLQQRQGILGATGAYRLELDGTVARKMSIFEITAEGIITRFNAEQGWTSIDTDS